MKDWLNDKRNRLGHKRRYLSVVRIRCAAHGEHTITISGDDVIVHYMGKWLDEESPFDVAEMRQLIARIYSPLTDYTEA